MGEKGTALETPREKSDPRSIRKFIEEVWTKLSNEDLNAAVAHSQTEKGLEESVKASGAGVKREVDWDIKNAVITDVAGAFENHLDGWRRTFSTRDPDSWLKDRDFKEQIKKAILASLKRKASFRRR